MRQRELVFRGRGGKRKGAGRKPAGDRAGISHEPRPAINASHAMHVTIRVAAGIPSMRTPHLYGVIRAATINVAEHQQRYRICQLSIQTTHIHLIVEADDKVELARGMRSFEVSVAKRINALLGRRGKVFTDRYHLVVIRSPKQMRAVLAYVFSNWRKHGADRRMAAEWVVDPYSSAYTFDGWAESSTTTRLWPPCDDPKWLVVTSAKSWLLREGWKRGGPPISVFATPGARPDGRDGRAGRDGRDGRAGR